MKNSYEGVEAFPLAWPQGRPRTLAGKRTRAQFHRKAERSWSTGGTYQVKEALTVADSRQKLTDELRRLGATAVIFSTNLELRLDGLPRSGQREPEDPGAAVYFQLESKPHCMSCDRWDRVADNLAAIAKHVDAVRAQERYGVADVSAMFAGFKSLPPPGGLVTPPPMTVEEAAAFIARHTQTALPTARQIVASAESFSSAYRFAAKRLHPDSNGGTHADAWHMLQTAAEVLRRHHGL